jgi:CMP-N-acetylneuraminic acid synthetase
LKTVAFIPARSGSKRLPGKNIRLLCGKPLIHYSIAYALSQGIDKILVSTDGDEIEVIAKKLGAEVVRRPPALCTDLATTADTAKHALEHIMKKGFLPDVFITLQPTNPLRPKELLKDCLAAYESSENSTIMTVTANKYKLGKINNGHFQTENYSTGSRSQDLKGLFYENGLIYLSRPQHVLDGLFFGVQIKAIEVEETFGMIDIDEELDFQLAEFILSKYPHKFSYLFD